VALGWRWRKCYQTLRRRCTKLYGGNVRNCKAANRVELGQLPVNVGWRLRNYYQTVRRQCTELYGGNLPNCTAAICVAHSRLTLHNTTHWRHIDVGYVTRINNVTWPSRWVRSVTSGAGVAMEELLPNLAAAMYQTVRQQCTKLYGGNWRRGRGGTLTKYHGTRRNPKTPHKWPHTTKDNLNLAKNTRDTLEFYM